MDINILVNQFKETFTNEESDQLRSFFSPGRINLIGEHTDLNEMIKGKKHSRDLLSRL